MESTFSLSSGINLWCSKSPGVIPWTSAGVYFFSCSHFPVDLPHLLPTFPKIASATPGDRLWTCSFQSNVWVGVHEKLQHVIMQLWGGCARSSKPQIDMELQSWSAFLCQCSQEALNHPDLNEYWRGFKSVNTSQSTENDNMSLYLTGN